jgi:hypothetical protein
MDVVPGSFFTLAVQCGDGPDIFWGTYKDFISAAAASMDLLPETLALLFPDGDFGTPVQSKVLECTMIENRIEVLNVRGVSRETDFIYN